MPKESMQDIPIIGQNMPTTITVKKMHIMDMRRWLDIPLPAGQLNRKRNEFVAVLKPFADEIEEHRLEIVRKYAKADDQGAVDITNPEFEGDNNVKAEADYQEMLKEPVVITVSKPMALDIAKSVIKSTQIKMGVEEGQRYEEVCQALDITFDEPQEAQAV